MDILKEDKLEMYIPNPEMGRPVTSIFNLMDVVFLK